MRKTIKNIKAYWDERAKSRFANPKATTDDYWLRIIEIREIKRVLSQIKNKKNILDIGCGDGFSTINIFKSFPNCKFLGGDYSEEMIKSAKALLERNKIKSRNIRFEILDVLDLSSLNQRFDVVISDRCIINLPNERLQKKAIKEIAGILKKRGYYIMVENFIEGHKIMNELRKRVGLKEIPIRWHNTYLTEKFLYNFLPRYFKFVNIKNISSIYYLITRVVYSKLCQIEEREPDYDHPIYKIAVDLDECIGNYGPVNLIVLKKKP